MDLEPSAPLNLAEYEALARARMDPAAWDYLEGGSGDELTLRANRAAFDRVVLRPRVLVDVSRCDTGTTVLGTPVAAPVLVAPVGYQRLAHPEGELATARAAAAAGTVMVVATMATASLEAIAQVAPEAPRWFQLYCFRDRGVTAELVQRAAAAGYRALMVTVDVPRLGRRERDLRNGFALPASLAASNVAHLASSDALGAAMPGESAIAAHARACFDPALSWRDLEWLRAQTALPVVLKGVLTAEDAQMAAERGVAGLVVSNHGGRQLDGAIASLEALPEVVDAVGARCEVYLDGGIRRGTDVLKALALGARAVLLGRPAIWGLAAHGAAGVHGVLGLLREELELAMALAGRPTFGTIDRTLLASPRCA